MKAAHAARPERETATAARKRRRTSLPSNDERDDESGDAVGRGRPPAAVARSRRQANGCSLSPTHGGECAEGLYGDGWEATWIEDMPVWSRR